MACVLKPVSGKVRGTTGKREHVSYVFNTDSCYVQMYLCEVIRASRDQSHLWDALIAAVSV